MWDGLDIVLNNAGVGSVHALEPTPLVPLYAGVKAAALASLTRSAAIEGQPRGARERRRPGSVGHCSEQSRLLMTVLIAHQPMNRTKGEGSSGEGCDLGRTRFAEIEDDELAGDRKQRN